MKLLTAFQRLGTFEMTRVIALNEFPLILRERNFKCKFKNFKKNSLFWNKLQKSDQFWKITNGLS